MQIKQNKAQCLECLEIVESKHRHDYVVCKCGAIAVDGGKDYLKRVGYPHKFKELSSYEKA